MRAVAVLLAAALAFGCALRPGAGARGGSAPAARAPIPPREGAETGETRLAAALDDAVTAAARAEADTAGAGLGMALRALYERAGGHPLWLREGRSTPQASVVATQLAQAADAGLRAADYDAAGLAARLGTISSKTPLTELVGFEVALSRALLRLLADLHSGRANPERARFSAGAGQDALVSLAYEISNAPDVSARIASAEPRYAGYADLRRALARYRALAEMTDLSPPPDLSGLRPGARSPLVPVLRRWLEALGDAPAGGASARSEVYDAGLVLAVRRFQERHGLAIDGAIGSGTAQALRVPLAARVRQIERTLERLRWLPEPGPQPPVVVNIPEFRLFVARAARPASGDDPDMKVIVGRAEETETPELSGEIEDVVFRPTWGVPHSIVVHEMLEKIRSDPAYLAKERLDIVGASGAAQPLSKAALAGLATGAFGLRQRAGPQNSLGLVKFVFPNDDDIFLHATPAKNLFARPRRDFSHGCVRVEDPVALAQFVLRSDPAWTRERIRNAMQSGGTSQVDVPSPVPVAIVYWTARAMPGGEVHFFDDLYRRDEALERQLAQAPPF